MSGLHKADRCERTQSVRTMSNSSMWFEWKFKKGCGENETG
jgi:hypothetical protein